MAQRIVTDLIPSMTKEINDLILLDSGSVTYNVANQLFAYSVGKIVTNDYAIAMLYHELEHMVPNSCRLLPGEMIKEVCAHIQQGGEEVARAAVQELTKGGHCKS